MKTGKSTIANALTAACLAAMPSLRGLAADTSPPVMIQYFESRYRTIENRMPDIFRAGYGGIYTPPPGRADQGNFSVGYDPYDRFDLGSPGNETLYGTETGMRTVIKSTHRAGMNYAIDLVWNHSGYSNYGTSGFVAAGGYPGLAITLPGDIDGDFHSAFQTGDINGRLAGLIDIAQEKNYQFIRQPTVAGPNNIPAGTTPAFGRLANVPNANNARFYPDTSQTPIMVYDPTTGQGDIPIYPFNTANPMSGDPVPENALGYLMRNTRWLVQDVGVDMFRMDATKHMPNWVLNYYDRAVYRASTRNLLDGSTRHVFGFGEYYDGSWAALQPTVKKNIDPSQPGVIGGNRDTLDFPLFFAMRDNLTGNGLQNNWNNVYNSSFDRNGDGLMNGSQGVRFVSSHDNEGPYLSTVAYAYSLMLPGNALVYFNASEFGTARNTFPKPGRGDALGGLYGDAITDLVDLRNRYGRGNYHVRFIEKENFAYEREKSALVMLSNRVDAGFDSRTIPTNFEPGQFLIELTGNAASITADPNNDIPELLVVNADRTVNARFLRNKAPGTNNFTGKGYLIYGLATPQGALSISNVAQTLNGEIPDISGIDQSTQQGRDEVAYLNATTRVNDVDVITADDFAVTLLTQKVNLLGNPAYRDHDADGDNALLRIDDGIDVNGTGTVDYRSPNITSYGFEEFTTVKQPGYTSANNNGTYTQNIDTTQLSEGFHNVRVIAYRHRSDGGEAVYSDFRKTIYVDRLKPVSAVDSFLPWDSGNSQNRDLTVKSTDQTADSVHVFLNLPAALTDAQILAMVGSGNRTSQIDRDLFKYGFFGVPSGNNVATIVTYEITGNVNVQRVPGILLATNKGQGFGDLNFDNQYTVGDVANQTNCFEQFLYSQDAQFNPAGDLDGNGRVNNLDLYQLPVLYQSVSAGQDVIDQARDSVLRRGDITGNYATSANAGDIDLLYTKFALPPNNWAYDFDCDQVIGQGDVDTLVRVILHSEYGDANIDGTVNSADFNILASNFGAVSGAGWAMGDYNGDGSVGGPDFNLLATNFGWTFNPGSSAGLGVVVPEPATISVVATSILLLTRRRRDVL